MGVVFNGRARRLTWGLISLLFLFLLTGCEEAEKQSSQSSRARSPGLVQARTADDGTLQVALAIAPEGSGLEAVPLDDLRGANLFDLADSLTPGVRRRDFPSKKSAFDESLVVFNPSWGNLDQNMVSIDSDVPIQIFDFDELPGNRDDGWVYSSNGYVAFNLNYKMNGTQNISFSNGTVTASATIRVVNGRVLARFNDDEEFSVTRYDRTVSPLPDGRFGLSLQVLLPLQCGAYQFLDEETLPRYLGRWTINGSPNPIVNEGRPNETPAFPRSFEVRGLVCRDVDFTPTPLDENGELTGGDFKGTFELIKSGPDGAGDNGPLAWTALIYDTSDTTAPVRTIYGIEPGFNGGPIEINGNWDGVGNFGVEVDPEKDYQVGLWGVIVAPPITPNFANPQFNSGRVATAGFTYSRDFFRDLKITPNPYVPPDYELEYNEFGELYWPYVDTDDDGEPDTYEFPDTVQIDGETVFVDEDGDGIPDIDPPENKISIIADLGREGYKIDNDTWTLNIYKEEDFEARTDPVFTEQGTGEKVNVDWLDPPPDLDGQMLQVVISFTECPTNKADLQVRDLGFRRDGPVDGCQFVECFGEVAYGGTFVEVPIQSIEVGVNPALESGPSGPYSIAPVDGGAETRIIDKDSLSVNSLVLTDPFSGISFGGPKPAVFDLTSDIYVGFNLPLRSIPKDIEAIDVIFKSSYTDQGFGKSREEVSLSAKSVELNRDDIEAFDNFNNGKLVFKLELPKNEVSRLGVDLELQLRADGYVFDLSEESLSLGGLGNMFYRILAEPDNSVQADGLLLYSAAEFNSVDGDSIAVFRVAGNSSAKSPLDIGTSFASGAKTEEEVMSLFPRRFVDNSTGFVPTNPLYENLSANNEDFSLSVLMTRIPGGNLRDVNIVGYTILRMLGVRDLELRMFSTPIFTQYLRPSGLPAVIQRWLPNGLPLSGKCDPVLSLSIEQSVKNDVPLAGLLHSVPASGIRTLQYGLVRHCFLIFDPDGSEEVYALWGKRALRQEPNPHLAINQLALGIYKDVFSARQSILDGTRTTGPNPWLVGKSREGAEAQFFEAGSVRYPFPDNLEYLTRVPLGEYYRKFLYPGTDPESLSTDNCTSYGVQDALGNIKKIDRLRVR